MSRLIFSISNLLIFLCLNIGLFVFTLNAQDFEIDFNFSDGQFNGTLTIGLSANGSDNFVEGIDIYAPPPAPSGAFDTYLRFNNESYIKKVLFNGNESKEIVTNYSKTTGNNPIQITWNTDKLPTSKWRLYFIDNFGGDFLVKTPITNFNGSIIPEEINSILEKQLRLIIEYDPTYTSLNEFRELPSNFRLFQNYPNPFNPITQIRYTLPKSDRVRLKVFDLKGNKIAQLQDQLMSAGSYSVTFNASSLPSGVYVYTLETTKEFLTKKMTLIK